MSKITGIRFAVTGMLLFSTLLWAREQIVADTTVRDKPYLIVRPAAPVAETDNVVLDVIIGTASNACMMPTFSNTSFSIHTNDSTPSGPQYTIQITYTKDPFPENKACTAVYQPVDYGPEYELGKLRAGIYEVVDARAGSQVEPQVYGRFKVSATQNTRFTIKGEVVDDPSPLKVMSKPVAGAILYLSTTVFTDSVMTSSDRVIAPVRIIDSTKTDERGVYYFTDIAAGNYTITCTHPNYRNASVQIVLRTDMVQNIVLLAKEAYASLTGIVDMVDMATSRSTPVKGCVITVSMSGLRVTDTGEVATMVPAISYRGVTDEGGLYMIENIPISANGEIWYVEAVYEDLRQQQRVKLSNMRTDTADFTFTSGNSYSDTVVVDGMAFSIGTDNLVYSDGMPISVSYCITNSTDETVSYGPFPSGCMYDLTVSRVLDDGETVIYSTLDRLACLDVESIIQIGPGKSVVNEFPDYYPPELLRPNTGELASSYREKLHIVAGLRGEQYEKTKVGLYVSVVVSPRVAVSGGAVKPAGAAGVSFNRNSGVLEMRCTKEQDVSVVYYTLSGAVVPGSMTTYHFAAGVHRVLPVQSAMSRGVYIVEVRSPEFRERFSAYRVGR